MADQPEGKRNRCLFAMRMISKIFSFTHAALGRDLQLKLDLAPVSLRETTHMTDKITISILIYTEHEPESLERTLQAVDAQEYPRDRLEVIVLDPDSLRERREIVAKYGRIYIIPANKDEPSALNEGLLICSGTYAAVTDDDCEPDSKWISLHQQALEDRFSLCGGPDKAPKNAPRFLRYLDYVLTSFIGTAGLRNTSRQGSAYYPRRWNMAFDKQKALEAGGLNGDMLEAWELDLAVRMRMSGNRVGFIKAASVQHRRATNLRGYLSRNYRLAKNRAGMRRRKTVYALPVILILCLPAAALFSQVVPDTSYVLAAMLFVYGAILMGSGLHAAVTLRDIPAVAAVPIMILMQHLTHAFGYTAGIICNGVMHVRQLCGYLDSRSGA